MCFDSNFSASSAGFRRADRALTHISRPDMSRIETGRSNPTQKELIAIGKVLGVPPDRLMDHVVDPVGMVIEPWIQWFLDHRVAVFPIQPGTKAPAVPRGTSRADWDDFVRPADRPVWRRAGITARRRCRFTGERRVGRAAGPRRRSS